MRPIDADTLLEKVEKIQPWEPYLGKYAQGIRHCMEIVSLLIRDAPTIESSAQQENTCENTCEIARTSNDCISRQAAIDEIEERKNANGYRNVAVISELNRLEGYIMRLPSAQPDNRLSKIAELVEGTIDHFDLDDAMDLLYQIKEIVGNETSNI